MHLVVHLTRLPEAVAHCCAAVSGGGSRMRRLPTGLLAPGHQPYGLSAACALFACITLASAGVTSTRRRLGTP